MLQQEKEDDIQVQTAVNIYKSIVYASVYSCHYMNQLIFFIFNDVKRNYKCQPNLTRNITS